MRRRIAIAGRLVAGGMVLVLALAVAGCTASASTPAPGGRSVVVTSAVLGAVVLDLVGDRAQVTVLMPNGVDPHDWSPSAKDIEAVDRAALVVENGLGLEAGIDDALVEAGRKGVVVFRATDHVTIRRQAAAGGETGAASATAAGDPHFWVDPVSMRGVVVSLALALATVGVDVADRAADLERRLDALDAETRATLAVVPAANRLLVTGHESMGYFADRYGLTLIGAVVPGLTSQGEVAAGQLADLQATIEAHHVKAIFTEIGTPASVVDAIARDTGVAVVQLPSHTLPADGSYFTFIRDIARAVADALR